MNSLVPDVIIENVLLISVGCVVKMLISYFYVYYSDSWLFSEFCAMTAFFFSYRQQLSALKKCSECHCFLRTRSWSRKKKQEGANEQITHTKLIKFNNVLFWGKWCPTIISITKGIVQANVYYFRDSFPFPK